MILHTENFRAQKLTTTWTIFFRSHPDQEFILFQNLIEWVHSFSNPHFIWTSSWLDWKTLFVILHTDNFWAQKLTTTWVFLSWATQIKKILLFQYLLGSIHSYSSRHFIWTIPWLDWKTLFVILHTENFWAQKLTTTWGFYSWKTQIKNSFRFRTF